jgi:hypothetical protein
MKEIKIVMSGTNDIVFGKKLTPQERIKQAKESICQLKKYALESGFQYVSEPSDEFWNKKLKELEEE